MIRLSQRPRNCWNPAKSTSIYAPIERVLLGWFHRCFSHPQGSFILGNRMRNIRLSTFVSLTVRYHNKFPRIPLHRHTTHTIAIGPLRAPIHRCFQGPQMGRSSDHSISQNFDARSPPTVLAAGPPRISTPASSDPAWLGVSPQTGQTVRLSTTAEYSTVQYLQM